MNTPPPNNTIYHGKQVMYEAIRFNGILCYRVKPNNFRYHPQLKAKIK